MGDPGQAQKWAFFQWGGFILVTLVITCACKVGYTGRFVVGRGRRWSDGCGLRTYEVLWNTGLLLALLVGT